MLRKMFIGGLNNSTTEQSLRTYFSQYGTVESTTVMKDPNNGRSPIMFIAASIAFSALCNSVDMPIYIFI